MKFKNVLNQKNKFLKINKNILNIYEPIKFVYLTKHLSFMSVANVLGEHLSQSFI